ncbi:Pleckstrin homology domain-containing family A member 8 [Taenia crassiceps]|uniref:Coronin n=1 Tax=Taenia crassiceps TaxID=6207 RepID=A0ABR4Q8G2_9CEST
MPSPLLHTTNPLWFPAGVEAGFEGVPISNAIHYGHLAACSNCFLAVATGFNAGGSVALLDLAKPGRYQGDAYHRTQCHSNSVTDLEWRGDVLATSSLDKTVKLWQVQGQDKASTLVRIRTLDHKDRVVNVVWCPVETSLLATALYGKKVLVWNVENGKVQSTHLGSAGGHSVCWSSSGCLAVASRDKRLCIFDVGCGGKKPVVSMICHQGSKPWKAAFLDDATLVTVGFGLEGTKELAIWDLKNPSNALDRARCSQSSGSVIMNYYQGNRFLFLSGRGDNGIQVYKYENRSMSMVGQFQSPHPYRDICWLQQEYLDTKSQEIGRCFRLFQPDTTVVLSTGSRRRNNIFSTNFCQQDFGAPIGLGTGQTRRKLSAPLIEPLSVRLQEGDNDDEGEDEEEEFATIKGKALINTQASKFAGESVVGVSKKPRCMSLSKKPHLECDEYVNGAVISMYLTNIYDKANKNNSGLNSTYGILSRRENRPQKPPPIPPKPKAKRIWNNWKMIPEAVQDRLHRMVERKPVTLKMKENGTHDCTDKGRHSDDEILFITTAFNRKRASISAHSSATDKLIQETDDEGGYATCSVSDLVAVFEAKAAHIAAMESASLCSDSLSNAPVETASALPFVTPAVTQIADAIVVRNELDRPGFTLEHPLTRASHLTYQPKPLNRMYTSSTQQRWSISHPVGIQMSPALRYMQRSQRTSVNLPRSTLQSNGDAATSGVLRRPSLRIPVSDSRGHLQEDPTEATLKRPLIRQQMEVSPSRKEWRGGAYLNGDGSSADAVSQPAKPHVSLSSRPTPPNNYEAKIDAPQRVSRQDEGSRLTGSCDRVRALSPSEIHLNNTKLREQLFDFLEKDATDASLSPTLEEPISHHSEVNNAVKDESNEIGSVGESTPASQTNEPLTSECDSIPEKLVTEKWDVNEELPRLRPSTEACKIVETQTYPERTSIRLIPVIAPVNPSKLSLLDEFRLLKTQWSSMDTLKPDIHVKTHETPVGALLPNAISHASEDTKYKSSITLGRSATFNPSYSSFIEPRRYRQEQGVMRSPSMNRHPRSQAPNQTSCTFYEGYAKYLRDLESTVRRCCGDCASDVTQPDSPNAQESRGCECSSESETEKSQTCVQYVALPRPRKVKEKDPTEAEFPDEPRSDCDETCVGTMTDADSDALSSTYSARTPNSQSLPLTAFYNQMEGMLFKWTNYINGWQQRYFTLRDGILSYYASESDVDTGCKGALKVSACEVVVHPTDACRFEILIPGEQRFFLKAANSTERQRWIIALGSCKAGITNVDEMEKRQQIERSIEAKRSELRINRDLLAQQINGVCSSLKLIAGENQGMIEAMASLKATCDTLLSNADELINLLMSSGRSRAALNAINTDGTSMDNRRPSTLPQSLQNDAQSGPETNTPSNDVSPRSTKIIEKIATTIATKSATNTALLNNHFRALRMSRPYPTFFSKLEFSFEDLALSHSAVATTSISAVEFLACCRSALSFFPALAATSSISPPTSSQSDSSAILGQLGSLQTVYAEVLADIVRLELAVKTLASGAEGAEAGAISKELAKQRSLVLSLADIVNAEVRTNQYRASGSAYLALLWLARSLNFAASFLELLFQDGTPVFKSNPSSNTLVVDIATKAYTKSLQAFHDWSVRGTATVILKAVPSAERLQAVLLDLPQNVKPWLGMEAMGQLQLDVERFVEALRRCLACIHSLLIERHLDPVFPPESGE